MDVIHKKLAYFWPVMLHEEGKEASPSQITEFGDLLPQMRAIAEYLNANYSELENEKVKYHYYKKRDRLLGFEIELDNPEDILVGTIRIYHRNSDNFFYYTFQCNIEVPINSKNQRSEASQTLVETLKFLGLRKLPSSGYRSPVIFLKFQKVDLQSFRIFYEKLRELSRSFCLMSR